MELSKLFYAKSRHRTRNEVYAFDKRGEMKITARPRTRDPAWILEQEGFDPSREREMETLFAIGNGRVGVRGASDFLIPGAQPDLLIAGIYDRKASHLPYSELKLLAKTGREGSETEIVPFPSPLFWKLSVGENSIQANSSEVLEHSRKLDLKEGISYETYRFEDQQGRRTITHTLKIASLTDPYLLVQNIEILSENYSGKIKIEFLMKPEGFDSIYPHLLGLKQTALHNGIQLTVYQTQGSRKTVAFGARAFVNQSELQDGVFSQTVKPGDLIRIIRYISFRTSCESEHPESEVTRHLFLMTWDDYESFLHNHTAQWNDFWEKANISLENVPALTHAQRFNLFHLRLAVDTDARVSIPAKALTGRSYEGHVFWDAEIFMFPFYLYTEPEIAKQLLMYRYHTLNGARSRAATMGCRGACYAWESTVTGKDVTPQAIIVAETQTQVPVHTGTQQIHVTADVAYAVWKYWDATLDHHFILHYGAEMFFETARFWADRVVERDSALHIVGVVGPDEYHFDVEDNAFTNWMARFNVRYASFIYYWMKRHYPDRLSALKHQLRLEENEAKRWKELYYRIYFPTPNQNGVIEQFLNFFHLKPITIPEYERNRPPISRLLNWQEVDTLQLIKQADVLMLPFLFPRSFSPAIIKSNYLYYEPITDHGSSLSPSIHAAIAARAGVKKDALEYWENSVYLDLQNIMGNTELGIHAAALGGTWQALVFHMLGVYWEKDELRLAEPSNIVLPEKCRGTSLRLTYRGRVFPISFSQRGGFAA